MPISPLQSFSIKMGMQHDWNYFSKQVELVLNCWTLLVRKCLYKHSVWPRVHIFADVACATESNYMCVIQGIKKGSKWRRKDACHVMRCTCTSASWEACAGCFSRSFLTVSGSCAAVSPAIAANTLSTSSSVSSSMSSESSAESTASLTISSITPAYHTKSRLVHIWVLSLQ